VQDHSAYSRAVVNAFENSGYFRIVRENRSQAEGDRQLLRGEVAFVLTIPEDFSRALLRGERPQRAARSRCHRSGGSVERAGRGHAARAQCPRAPASGRGRGRPGQRRRSRWWRTARYNPEGISQYNTVPGLLGVILTMTMVMMPALALTREPSAAPWRTCWRCRCRRSR
jgi:ABC-2 type transport system permease protein